MVYRLEAEGIRRFLIRMSHMGWLGRVLASHCLCECQRVCGGVFAKHR